MAHNASLPLPVPVPTASLPSWLPPLHASALTLGYVGAFYLSSTIRKLPKDDPRVMKSRLRVASVATALGVAATGLVLWKGMEGKTHPVIRLPQVLLMLGLPLPWSVPTALTDAFLPLKPGLWEFLRGHLLPAIGYPLALTASLFVGPLYVEWLEGSLPLPAWACRRTSADDASQQQQQQQPQPQPPTSALDKVRAWLSSWCNLHGLRNFVIGPTTEELIWRSCILSVTSYTSPLPTLRWLIFGTPLYFGLAHLHHFYESYVLAGRSLQFAALQSGIQFAYTSVFGWYANWLWLRTGSAAAPLAAHVFCNIMGLPNPWSAAKRWPEKRLTIFAAHVAGIALFAANFDRMTRPELFGGSLYWRS